MPKKPQKINIEKLAKLLEVKRGIEQSRQDILNRTEFVIPKAGVDYFTEAEKKQWFSAISDYIDKLFIESSTEFFSEGTINDIKNLVFEEIKPLIKNGKDGKDGKDAIVDYEAIISKVVSELDLPDYEKLIEKTVKKIDAVEKKTETLATKKEVEDIKDEVKQVEIKLNERISLSGRVAGGGSNVTVKLNGALVGSGTILDFSGSGISSITHNGNTASINISGGGAGISDGDKGDITVSNSGATWMIDNLAVTNAKINDVAWSKVSGTPTTLAGYGITDAVDGAGVANRIAYWSDSNTIDDLDTATYPSLTELSYLKGVTSAIQTQLDNKQPLDAQLTSLAGLSYTGNAGKFIRVNAGETDFELASVSASPGGSDKQVQYNSSSSFAGAAGFEVGNTNNRVLIEAQAATEKPLILKMATSQSAEPFDIQNSSGNSIFRINTSGFPVIYDGAGSAVATFRANSGVGMEIFNTGGLGMESWGVVRLKGSSLPMVGKMGISFSGAYPTPTALLHLAAGTASAETAPLKFTAGTNLTSPEAGAVEFNGTNLFYTTSTPARKTIANLEDAQTFASDISVPDEAYDATAWNGSLEVPTKNAIRDKIESLGGGSGITRTVVVTSGSATMGSTASTDYVYFVAGAHTMSLPAASGNTNRYTVKNNHSANITIDTAGAENIEGAATISIAPEESVDIMSDGTNWFVV